MISFFTCKHWIKVNLFIHKPVSEVESTDELTRCTIKQTIKKIILGILNKHTPGVHLVIIWCPAKFTTAVEFWMESFHSGCSTITTLGKSLTTHFVGNNYETRQTVRIQKWERTLIMILRNQILHSWINSISFVWFVKN